LIDYATYADKNSIAQDPLGRFGIPLSVIKQIAQESGIKFQPGDIFILRTGFVKGYNQASQEKRKELAERTPPQFCGIGQGRETTEWLWERQFAAVVADSPAFECSRKCLISFRLPELTHCKATLDPDWHLHPILLAGWGTPIGELFDLEGLAEMCKKHKRWSFFLSSAPLNYSGAVASPPNAIAFF
jgi:kynurenine formamidase